jgi:hypothetical protein
VLAYGPSGRGSWRALDRCWAVAGFAHGAVDCGCNGAEPWTAGAGRCLVQDQPVVAEFRVQGADDLRGTLLGEGVDLPPGRP